MNKTKILIVPNSFKECSDSVTTTKLISTNLRSELNRFEIIEKPLSDGGDGFLECIRYSNKKFEPKIYSVNSYNNLPKDVPVLIIGKELFIESADVVGLKLIPPSDRNPLKINTAPLGELLIKIDSEVKQGKIDISMVTIGIGGTATNDLGLGVCDKYGLELINSSGQKLNIVPSEFNKAARIIWHKPSLSFKIRALTDVNTPLMGKKGTAALFARQKGANNSDIAILELGFKHILNLIKEQEIYNNTGHLPGAGGGLAAGLRIFLGAEFKTSKAFIEKDLNLDKIEEPVDYLITGEGNFDSQSFYGKSPGIVLAKYESAKKYIICGKFFGDETNWANTRIIELIKYFRSKEESILNFETGIKLACEEIIADINQEV